MRRIETAGSIVSAIALAALVGCSSSNDNTTFPPDASLDTGGPDTGALDTGAPDTGASEGGPDAEADAALATPTFLAHFAKAQGQLPEGLWETTAPIVGWAPLASLDTVANGTPQSLSVLGTASNTLTLGITSNASGRLYVGVGAASAVGEAPPSAVPVTPAPGVYSLPDDGGAPTLFSLGSLATPPMNFANGLVFIGPDLFVADSEGVVYKIDSGGSAVVWSRDPLLAPSQPACGGIVPLAIGANGIAADAANVYVTNTNFGRVVQIPVRSDGTAGTATSLAESCATLAGADGLALDTTDGSFLVAVNAQNRIVRVGPSETTLTVIAEGAPLDTPASVFIDSLAQPKRLLITNSSFFSAADAGAPGLLALPMP